MSSRLNRIAENGTRPGIGSLADFRSQGGEEWDELLTQIVATMAEGLVTMERVAQDGMRVRADAGKSLFRPALTCRQFLRRCRHSPTLALPFFRVS